MIIARFYLCPRGDRTKEIPLGTAEVFNDVSGTLTSGNYGYRLLDRAGRKFKTGNIVGFPRKRLLVFDLLFRVLRHAFGDRNELV